MALSLGSIHQPLNDFFLSQFKTDAASPVLFRFDRFGSLISAQDFIDPRHPELGYLPGLATEKFSDLVNRIPVDEGDDLNIELLEDSIDTAYFYHLLTPSIPYIPQGIDGDAKQAIIQTFSLIKSDALTVWNNQHLESLTGQMLSFKPSIATPQDWYDDSKDDVWTQYSFQVTDANPAPAGSAPNQLWRLAPSNEIMGLALQLPQVGQLPPAVNSPPAPPPINIAARLPDVQAAPNTLEQTDIMASRVDINRAILEIAKDVPEQARDVNAATPIDVGANAGANVAANLGSSVVPLQAYVQQFSGLEISQRLLVNQYLGENTSTQPVQTSSITVSFDYCLVNIQRSWFMSMFIDDTTWCVPTLPRGQMTASGRAGSLPLLPIGFVAIRHLSIEAPWTAEDIQNASTATDLGPFKVTADIVNNKLSHPGLQVIGWILQKMPDLPPNDAPDSIPN